MPIDLDFQHEVVDFKTTSQGSHHCEIILCACAPLYYRLIMVHDKNLYQLNEPIGVFFLQLVSNYNTHCMQCL